MQKYGSDCTSLPTMHPESNTRWLLKCTALIRGVFGLMVLHQRVCRVGLASRGLLVLQAPDLHVWDETPAHSRPHFGAAVVA
jgi:hypothetical protein